MAKKTNKKDARTSNIPVKKGNKDQQPKEKGILTYITSNKWMRAGYGEKLREYFVKYNPILLIDLGSGVFDSATVDTNILMIKKEPYQNILTKIHFQIN